MRGDELGTRRRRRDADGVVRNVVVDAWERWRGGGGMDVLDLVDRDDAVEETTGGGVDAGDAGARGRGGADVSARRARGDSRTRGARVRR